MKYSVGTVFAARMSGAKSPDDMVRATILKYRPYYNDYEMSIVFQLRPERDYISNHSEKIIESWLESTWYIEHTPSIVKLDEDLFTL